MWRTMATVAALCLAATGCASSDESEEFLASTSTPATDTSPGETDAPDPTVADDDDGAASSPTTAAASATTSAPTVPPIPDVALERIDLDLELVASLQGPVGMAIRPGTDDLYVIEQRGRVRRVDPGDGTIADTAVLDLRGQVSGGNEQGLLGIAFADDGDTLFVHYTDTAGDTVVARYEMVGDVADPDSIRVVLVLEQLRGNHNGGQLVFGPDGHLYIGLGDGGGGGDPGRHGQNPATLLGSILRIDVSDPDGYTIPPDNPFVGGGGAPEVFAWGIRNAWRFGFDPATGDLWVADVGQDRFEEITVLRAVDGGGNGANLGWNFLEGFESYRGGDEPPDHAGPIAAYSHGSGRCSITGGEVYRGRAIPALVGTYVFGDFCNGEIMGLRVDGSGGIVSLDIPRVDELTSFGVGADGELYAMGRPGGVFRIVAG